VRTVCQTAPLKWQSIVSARSDDRGCAGLDVMLPPEPVRREIVGVKWLITFLGLAGLALFLLGVYVARRRAGVPKPRLKENDVGCGCLVVAGVTAVVAFVGAWWFWNKPFWLALLIGLGCAGIWLLQFATYYPGGSEKQDS
jgi:hypothetical protein